MKLKKITYVGAVIAAVLSSTALVYGQSLEFLGVTNDGLRAQIKAKVDLAGRTPAAVTAYSYNMTDGYTVSNTNYEFVYDGETTYLTADVFFYAGEPGYTHRIEITFNDGGPKYVSPVVNEDLTEAFMWLGDYNYSQGGSGWENHLPTVDREIDPSLTMMLDGVHYYKGLSNHATGHLLYKFPEASFSKFVSKYGVQDDRTEGNVRFEMYTATTVGDNLSIGTLRTNMAPALISQVMYAKSNNTDAGKTGPFVRDVDLDMTGKQALLFYFDSNGANYGDHAHLPMARLYMPVQKVAKQHQTLTFNTPSQTLSGDIELDALASSNGTVFYRIISGRNLATLEGNVLRPVWGASGSVVVEATQYGDDSYYPVTAYQTFDIDLQPKMQLLDIYSPTVTSASNKKHAYLLVDTKGRELDKLNVTVYDNPRTRVKQSEINLLEKYYPTKGRQIIDFELPDMSDRVLRVAYSYKNDEKIDSLAYWHSEGSFDYMSDLPASAYRTTVGWGQFPGANKSFGGDNNGRLSIVANSGVTYAKGFGLHASGSVEVQPEALAPYNRVAVDMGAQVGYGGNTNQVLSYSIVNGNMLLKTTQTYNEATGTYSGGDLKKSEYVSWDTSFNNSSLLRLYVDKGSDGDPNDHVCIGAPRLYYMPVEKTQQSIEWRQHQRLVNNAATEVVLDAVSSNEMPVYYYIVKGAEYAYLDGNKLLINNFPAEGQEVVVDAYQPGDDVFGPANVVSCTFSLVHGLEIQRGQYVELGKSDTLDELIIHADKDASGQLNIKSGIVNVKKIVLKYTFNPGEWTYISFPSDLNIDNISNLNELGYTFNGFNVPSYSIRELNGDAYSTEEENANIWTTLSTPLVQGMKGYTMYIDDTRTDLPVEVTFTINNEGVDLVNVTRSLGLSLDFSYVEPDTKKTVTVTAANPNVTCDNLTIEVEFKPENVASLPLNHAKALERMRYTFVNGHKAIRLTLPDQTPARVVLFDEPGKKVVKAIKYIAPNVIDLRDVKPGKYNMVVTYGPATKTLPIEL